MMNLEKFFVNQFNSERISDDELKQFADDHINQLGVQNDNNQYGQMINDTVNAYNDYFGSITSEDTATVVRKARTKVVDTLIDQFKTELSRQEGKVRSEFDRYSPEYLEFFPRGLDEYHQANKENIETLMKRVKEAALKYETRLGIAFRQTFEDFFNNYTAARQLQLSQKGLVADEKSQTADSQDALENQLMKNLLQIATAYVGKPEKLKNFFDQSLLVDRSSGGPDPGTPGLPDLPPIPPGKF